MGISTIEDHKSTACCLSPKIYQPADDMEGLMEFPKKKMFSSSSFYDEPKSIYPTVEEQVKLCRKIAESLSDDCNVKSKGANMFFKRVKKAEKWIVAEFRPQGENIRPARSDIATTAMTEESSSMEITKDPTKMPYVRPSQDGPHSLRLILDPRHLVDMQCLLRDGVDIVKHDTISPEVCHDLVKDLNSPIGRGGQLFAKRKKKSEEWIVDEEKVKHLLEIRYHGEYSTPDPNRLDSQIVAETVIRAAEAKVMSYPNAVPHMPVIESLDGTTNQDWSKNQSEAYKVRAPKGWTSNTESPLPAVPEMSALPEETITLDTTSNILPRYSPLSRSMSFNNFNASPRAWNADLLQQFRPAAIKSVRPPSVLLVQ